MIDYHQALDRAKRAVVRAAMGIINSDGWAFQTTDGKYIVLFPDAMRRLEKAIANLKEARRKSKPRRKKHA